MQNHPQLLFRTLAVALASATLLASCSGGEQTGQAGPAGGPPPAPTVGVVVAVAESVPLVSELPGRTSPYMVAELRPQVTGIVQKRLFTRVARSRPVRPCIRSMPPPIARHTTAPRPAMHVPRPIFTARA